MRDNLPAMPALTPHPPAPSPEPLRRGDYEEFHLQFLGSLKVAHSRGTATVVSAIRSVRLARKKRKVKEVRRFEMQGVCRPLPAAVALPGGYPCLCLGLLASTAGHQLIQNTRLRGVQSRPRASVCWMRAISFGRGRRRARHKSWRPQES